MAAALGGPTKHVVLAYNDPGVRLERAIADLRHLLARIDRAGLGRSWSRKTAGRTDVVAVPENIGTNPHWHVYGSFACDLDLIEAMWRAIACAGTVRLQDVTDPQGLLLYISKQFNETHAKDGWVMSRMFWQR